ncbi:Bug family tripartite tricarboxylate transporter substrate binding protein [Salipiger sp.]|uniref:Bug family tripartite tricarboxylate transporter substrate binding protein n=1 Tax=Salipiger sp. TaxID=2078585 RepID=UPI003A97D91E
MKSYLAGLALSLATILGGAAAALDYPDRTITLVVPYGAGGGSDLVGRAIAEAMARQVDVPVVVRNITGQSGVVGSRAVRDADPDGYTLLVGHGGLQTLYHSGLVDFTYLDMTPVALMVSGTEAIAVNAAAEYDGIGDLIAAAKAAPGTLRFGVSLGSTSHFLAESLMEATGAEFQLVGYDGASERSTALAGGHIDVISGGISSLQGYLDAGNIKLLGLADTARSASAPDLETLDEQGVAVDDSFVARGLIAPPGLDDATRDALVAILTEVAADPAFAADLKALAYDAQFLSGAEFDAYLNRQNTLVELLAGKVK